MYPVYNRDTRRREVPEGGVIVNGYSDWPTTLDGVESTAARNSAFDLAPRGDTISITSRWYLHPASCILSVRIQLSRNILIFVVVTTTKIGGFLTREYGGNNYRNMQIWYNRLFM